jgi:hypothetical protein
MIREIVSLTVQRGEGMRPSDYVKRREAGREEERK